MPISGGLLGTGGLTFGVVVQADLSGTAFGGAPTWTDITRFARLGPSPISINKWRQDQLSDVAPSTMTLVLDNADLPGDATAPNAGRFTPFLTTSPWSPHILPGVRIRVGVTVAGVTYWRFDGYIDIWDASYDNGEFGICTVSASDMLARLGAGDPLRTLYVEEVLVDGPVCFYPLTEAAGFASASDISGNSAPQLVIGQIQAGDVAFGSATGIPTDGTSTLTLNASLTTGLGDDDTGDFLYTKSTVTFPTNDYTIEAFISVGSTFANTMSRAAGSGAIVAAQTGGPSDIPRGIRLMYDAGAIRIQDPVFATVGYGPDLNDGGVHHLVVVNDKTSTNTQRVYVDGALVGTSAVAALAHAGSWRIVVGGIDPSDDHVPGSVHQAPFRGGVGYVAAYSSALSPARIAAHNTAARTAFSGEGTATHLSRLLTYRPNLGAILDTGQGTVGLHAFAGVSEQQAVLDTVKAEGGLIYTDAASGKLVFLDRTRLRNPVSAVTLDITAQQVTADLNVRADRDLLLNDVTITRPGGAGQRRTDQTSKDTHGTKGLDETLIIATDTGAANAAGWILANGKDVRARTPALKVDLLTEPSPTVAAGVLGLVPLQRVTLSNPPASMAAADVIVQGGVDTIGIDVLECAFFVSPMPRPTLRFDAAADSFTKLDSGLVFAW